MSIAQLIIATLQLGVQGWTFIYTKNLMDNLTDGEWLIEQARKFGFQFDQICVKYADKVYDYFEKIVGGTLITPSVTNDIMNRVYVIIGLFIFFKIAMIAIKYMVNPEMFQDDKVGAQTLVKRVIIGSIIIILTPLIFRTASELQASIISDNVIEKIILPRDVYNKLVKSNHKGKDLAMVIYKGFFGWNTAIPTDKNRKIYDAYDRVIKYGDIGSFDEDYITKKSGDDYYISYVPIIATLAVGYLLFMLIKYAMEVAFRSLKLFFLQLISPFAIVNYMIDPSKEEVMKKWINTTISTYLLIFIRVLTLWLASLMAYYLANGIPISGTETSLLNDTDPLLKALIALAVFAFTKDLPKVLSEIFGYNLQENETISGIMSQGVGIVKGLALAKVGSSFAKKQMGMNALSSGLGGVSAGLGGLSEAGLGQGEKAQAFNAKHPKLTRGAGMIAGVGANLSPAFSNINSTMGQGVSSSFGSSILSPISNSASLAGRDYVYASKHAPSGHDSSTNESGAHGNAPSKVTQNQELNNQNNNVFDQKFFDSILANSNFNDYIQGGNINLSSAVSNNTAFGYNEGYAANNPIVTEMANAVADRAGVSIDSQTISDISGAINTQLGDTSIVHDINNCTPQELSTVMNNVYTYVVATKNQGNLTPVAGNNT